MLARLLTCSLLLFSFCLVLAERACEDGKDNVVTIQDLNGEEAKVQFKDVTVLAYDTEKKPLCSKSGSPLIKFPGFLKLGGGQIHVTEPLNSDSVKLLFTSEHNSFFIGQVCLNGKSENAFVADDLCEVEMCELVGEEICGLLTKKQVIEAPTLFEDFFPLPENPVSELGGEWRLDVRMDVAEEEVARIRVGRSDEWIRIGEEEEEAHEEL
ncbi:hypothetical protein M3Y99_00414900 [Aphelenchoides fujianensis]|nr:hypothetical protein M3Y99_00414900 [Aphelenchoides fujianensis]